MNLTFKIFIILAAGFLSGYAVLVHFEDKASPAESVLVAFLMGVAGALTAMRWFPEIPFEATRRSASLAAGYLAALGLFLACIRGGATVWSSLLIALVLGVWICKMFSGNKYMFLRPESDSNGGP